MRIGAVAKQAGVSVDTVRFYERVGVLPPAQRTDSGYRDYAPGTVERIRLTRDQPPATWNLVAPHEYGFYANVNPDVDHPRWSQKRERRVGELLRRPTLPFNGYGEQVAHLYAGMDLRADY